MLILGSNQDRLEQILKKWLRERFFLKMSWSCVRRIRPLNFQKKLPAWASGRKKFMELVR